MSAAEEEDSPKRQLWCSVRNGKMRMVELRRQDDGTWGVYRLKADGTEVCLASGVSDREARAVARRELAKGRQRRRSA